jgi:hypothetical protein
MNVLKIALLLGCAVTITSPGLAKEKSGNSKAKSPAPQSTKTIMDSIFSDIQELLPLSLNEAGFADPRNKGMMEAKLGHLAENAGVLQKHAGHKTILFQHLATALAEDARKANEQYRLRHFGSAAFLVTNMTNTCTSCHSRIPALKDAPKPSDFLKKIEIDSLGIVEKVRILMVSRQFDAALTEIEKYFATSNEAIAGAYHGGLLIDYLTLTLRVKPDLDRAIKNIKLLVDRNKEPLGLSSDLNEVFSSLDMLAKQNLPKDPLAAGRAVIEQAKKDEQDSGMLPFLLVSSRYFNTYLESNPTNPQELAELYYYLGLTSSRSNASFWTSESQAMWDYAIASAPTSKFAKLSLDRLCDQITWEYSGSMGVDIPADVEKGFIATAIKVKPELTAKKNPRFSDVCPNTNEI